MPRSSNVNRQQVYEIEGMVGHAGGFHQRRLEYEREAARKMCSGEYTRANGSRWFRKFIDEAVRQTGEQFSAVDKNAAARGLARHFENVVDGYQAGHRLQFLDSEIQSILKSPSCKR